MNRFKGKISTIGRDGPMGMVSASKAPIDRQDALDSMGFRSGMSNATRAVPNKALPVDTQSIESHMTKQTD